MSLSEDTKLAFAKDVTAAFVNNDAGKVTPDEAVAMLKAVYAALDELSEDKSKERKVGLG
jgi:predicted transcriptional regulator